MVWGGPWNQAWLREAAESQAVRVKDQGWGRRPGFPVLCRWSLHAQGGGCEPENGAKWKAEAGLRMGQVKAGMEMGWVRRNRSVNGVMWNGAESRFWIFLLDGAALCWAGSKLPKVLSLATSFSGCLCVYCFDLWVVKESHLKTLCFKRKTTGASLVAQCLGVCLLMQGTWVRALVWEDPTCCGATKPMCHNYWARAPRAHGPQQERPRQWEARAPQWRVAPARHN